MPSRCVNLSLMSLEERMVFDTGLSGGGLPIDNMQPWIALNYLVAVNGMFPDIISDWQENKYGIPNVGEISLFAGNFAPSGYTLANGKILSISQYPAVCAVLGFTYGGNGTTNFALPNLQGVAPVGVGSGSDLSPSNWGELQGTPTTNLLVNNLPSHSHNLLTAGGIPIGEITGNTGSGVPFSKQMPTLGVNLQMVLVDNVDLSNSYLGEVAINAGKAVPHSAQGQLLSISQYQDLFNQIGTTFGGDGIGTFALPDLQGRMAIGAGNGFVQGQMGGVESITLTTTDLATHTHLQGDTNSPTSATGGGQAYNNMSPFNTVTYAINTSGIYPELPTDQPHPTDTPFLGQIKMFTQRQSQWPEGWVPCDGRLLPTQSNQPLFAILGNVYGGDGINTFALPNLQGRVPIGAGTDNFGNTYTLGQTGGSQTVNISIPQMATHLHSTPAIVSVSNLTQTANEPVTTSELGTTTRAMPMAVPSGESLIYSVTRDTTESGGVVQLTLGGTASSVDYSLSTLFGGSFTVQDDNTLEVTFDTDALEVVLVAEPVQDGMAEPRESLILSVKDGAEYQLHFSDQSATGYLSDSLPLIISGGSDIGGLLAPTGLNLYSRPGETKSGSLTPFPQFGGEVRMATGDFNGDGIPEVIAAPGKGGSPEVRVLDIQTGEVLFSFMAYDPKFKGGVFVAFADVNGDGVGEILTGAGAGGGPHVRIFDGKDQSVLASYFAFPSLFRGGVTLAGADLDGDGQAEVVCGAGPGGGPHVRLFHGTETTPYQGFYAFDAGFTGGVFVTAGNLGIDGRTKIVTGSGVGGNSEVRVWDYHAINDQITDSVTQIKRFKAFESASPMNTQVKDMYFQGGVRVGLADWDDDGFNDLVVGAGPGGGPHVKVFSGIDYKLKSSFFTREPEFHGGVFVG